jgi:imidazole glycerol-phosphate synthase subunit HisF
MLRPRITPCLLIRNRGLVKTVNFRDGKYVGDPINAVRIFNEKEVDELIVLDIDATAEAREPDFRTIEYLAAECRMPFCYGGGVKTVEQALRIFALGVEKIAISSAAVNDPQLVARLAERVGTQSVVVVIDVKKDPRSGAYRIFTHNGRNGSGKCLFEFCQELERLGSGEIIINSIDNDGVMMGYDLELAERIRSTVSVPLTVLGGAGSLRDIGELIGRFGIIGAAAGSLFVFKGIYKAVLINYPSRADKAALIAGAMGCAR